ncbi:geranylgeranyl pyrophosphate synthase [Carbonactinospora thermoautotrophica]|uniref:Geranylgeranyl pyrophosphate synthase n=1 Tax=Carbonactinospora thermoautotrophica TaxID=1469144 RepID=A0A132N0X7_9ACTN|nr:polyprenyl synthetase family protein [Carbonactinospora thermoautotrophica]KWX03818.1 geranylgeranyl pyrophosphate synthase [Carbonactinospora thermoautotrophica]KWX08495.1 geranylgeranyl pyrophosphate synthase [Carbonactinospora thermoautotrophica]
MTAAGPFGLITSDQALLDDITQGLAAVEEMLRDATKSSYDFITQASQHLMNAGGKRFRPLLVLLAAQFGDKHAPGVVPAAVVVEITHLATLYHDDVMDEAPLRRGVRSVNSQWNNSVAILTGDFLFARASDILADLGPEAVRIQARTFERLVTGQIRESMGPGSDDDPIEHYLSVVADKTGSLIATSGRFGAMLSGADETVVDIMTNFGERIGVAFQLSDDLLDVASDSAQSGKTPGTDLREGVPTLPVLYAKASQDPGDARLRELLDGDLTDDARLAEALDLLRAHPAMDAARRELRRYAESARELLAPLPDIPAKAALAAICDQVVNRTG